MKPKFALKIPTLDHRDRDFLKSFNFAGVSTPVFPDEYNTDAGLWMPNQDATNAEFPGSPAQPFGCTNFTTCDLASDLDGVLHNPAALEVITHANQNGGAQIRDVLMAAKKISLITGFYNIKAYAPLDYFDAIRFASFSGMPEKRSVSMGTPWYSEWQNSVLSGGVNMPMPQSLDYTNLPWHNWKIGGWKTINGVPYLRAKPWEGPTIGDKGWLNFDRHTINAVMTANKYTVAFTATHATPTAIYTIDMSKFDYLMSFFKTMLGLHY